MTIKIEKEEKIEGKIRFYVYQNNAFDTGFDSEQEAREYVEMLKENIKKGLPRKETILEETV